MIDPDDFFTPPQKRRGSRAMVALFIVLLILGVIAAISRGLRNV